MQRDCRFKAGNPARSRARMSSRSNLIVSTLSDRGPSFQYERRKHCVSSPHLKLARRPPRSVAAATFTFYLAAPASSIHGSRGFDWLVQARLAPVSAPSPKRFLFERHRPKVGQHLQN